MSQALGTILLSRERARNWEWWMRSAGTRTGRLRGRVTGSEKMAVTVVG